jgi:hypothetical protein
MKSQCIERTNIEKKKRGMQTTYSYLFQFERGIMEALVVCYELVQYILGVNYNSHLKWIGIV